MSIPPSHSPANSGVGGIGVLAGQQTVWRASAVPRAGHAPVTTFTSAMKIRRPGGCGKAAAKNRRTRGQRTTWIVQVLPEPDQQPGSAPGLDATCARDGVAPRGDAGSPLGLMPPRSARRAARKHTPPGGCVVRARRRPSGGSSRWPRRRSPRTSPRRSRRRRRQASPPQRPASPYGAMCGLARIARSSFSTRL